MPEEESINYVFLLMSAGYSSLAPQELLQIQVGSLCNWFMQIWIICIRELHSTCIMLNDKKLSTRNGWALYISKIEKTVLNCCTVKNLLMNNIGTMIIY